MTRHLVPAIALLASATTHSSEDVLEEITTVGTRRAVDTSQVALSVSATSGTAIDAAKLATDALASLPGVTLQQTTPGQGAAIVRGLKGSAVLHLVDGMRLSNAIFRSAPTPWFALVPTTSIERLEVVRGTPAALYGSEAVGGVVQSVSRLPQFDDETIGHARNVSVAFDTAERQRAVRASLDAGTRDLAGSVSAEYLQTGDRRIGGGARIGPSGFTARALRAVLRGTPAGGATWLFDVHYLEQPQTPRVDELVPGFGQDEPSSSEFDFSPNRRVFAHLGFERAWHGLDWKIDAAWQRIDDDRVARDFGAAERRFEANRSDLYGVTVSTAGGHGGASWIIGADVYYDEVRSARRAVDITTGATGDLAPRFPDGSTISQAGVFASHSWDIGTRHRLTLGARYTGVDIDLPDDPSIRPDRLSGDIGWIVAAGDHLHFVVNAGSGFRAPNIADLGTLGNRPGNRFNIPNTGLGAERVVHGDVGLRFRNGRVSAELLLFALRYSDRIVSVATGATTPDGRDVVQSVNAAASDLHGVEAGASIGLSERLDARIVLNYVRGTQDVGGVEEPGDRIPPLNGRLELRFDLDENWQLETRLIAARRQDRLSARDVDDVRIDPAGTAGWANLGARARWSGGAGWRVDVGIDNVLDKRYRVHGSGIDGPGRNLTLAIRRAW